MTAAKSISDIFSRLTALIVLMSVPLGAAAQTGAYVGEGGVPLDAPYVATPPDVVRAMLDLAQVKADDVVYDLGSGDGRLVIAAARDFDAKKAVGIDLDPARVSEARANARAAGVADRALFHQGDLFGFDFSEATVVTLYLLPEMISRLRPRLERLTPGTRIVTHAFAMGEWRPDAVRHLDGRTVYFWIVPAAIAGTWSWSMNGDTAFLDLRQSFQQAEGVLRMGGATIKLDTVSLEGAHVLIAAHLPDGRALTLEGHVTGNQLTATLETAGRSSSITAVRRYN